MKKRLSILLVCYVTCLVMTGASVNAQKITSILPDNNLFKKFSSYSGLAGIDRLRQTKESNVADCFFTTEYLLPQTLNQENLSSFLSMEHHEYHLDGWFFMGHLIDGKGPATEDKVSTFIFSVQRKDVIQISGSTIRIPLFPSIVGFNSAGLNRYLFGGAVADASQVTVTPDPWSVVAVGTGHPSIMSMTLVKGKMGMKGAVYHLASDVIDQEGHGFQTDVWIEDVYGIINDGYGPASFFPSWITAEQREKILSKYDGSVEDYLYGENDPMVSQGDYYYSAPKLKVKKFKITRDNTEVLSEGTRGELWMDYTVASYSEEGLAVVDHSKWQFFAVQLKTGSKCSLLLLNTETLTSGSLPLARLYGKKSAGPNKAINATYTWDMNKITFAPVQGSEWTSPASGQTYYKDYTITLRSDQKKYNADFTFSLLRENSEIYIEGQNPCYEGMGTIQGTLGGKKVSGYAFAEFELNVPQE